MPEQQWAKGAEITQPRTVLGFDFGQRRIGVAVGQELTGMARPIATLPGRQSHPDWPAISRLIAQWRPDLLVVGIARHADGTPTSVTVEALRFSRQLHEHYHLPVETIDERLSSWEAENLIAVRSDRRRRQGKAAIDQVAAALILESWFNQQRA